MSASRKVANQQKRQANKILQVQGIRLSKILSANANLRLNTAALETERPIVRWVF